MVTCLVLSVCAECFLQVLSWYTESVFTTAQVGVWMVGWLSLYVVLWWTSGQSRVSPDLVVWPLGMVSFLNNQPTTVLSRLAAVSLWPSVFSCCSAVSVTSSYSKQPSFACSSFLASTFPSFISIGVFLTPGIPGSSENTVRRKLDCVSSEESD